MKKLIPIALALFSFCCTQAQVFVAQASLEDFYENSDITEYLQNAGYESTQISKLPSGVADPMRKMTRFIDENLGRKETHLFMNNTSGSFLLYGVDGDDVYSYSVNFFPGNENAVSRIRELFEKNGLTFDHQEANLYYYFDGEEAGGIVGLLENDLVMFSYFEP